MTERRQKLRKHMDILLLLLIFVGWFALQRWILPRMGVQT